MKIIARVGTFDSGKDSSLLNQSVSKVLNAYLMSEEELINNLQSIKTGECIFIKFLEGLDGGLHPKDQRELMDKVEAIENQGTFIFTTNSPYMVDELKMSQVQVWYKDKYKFLSEHPDAEWGSKTLTTGEFWDANGENWVEI